MAEMVPDRMPSGASAGEKKLFDVLQQLPDDCIVYYEPAIRRRHPDFVVIIPRLGLLVIEVKGWYAREIVQANSNDVLINARGTETQQRHPVRQAREYMFQLMNECRDHQSFHSLLKSGDPYAGRFVFPFGHFAILSNIASGQLAEQEWASVFPPDAVATRDQLAEWQELEPEQLQKTLQGYFDPFWDIPPLVEAQINALRAVIHPEIILLAPPRKSADSDAVREERVSYRCDVLDLRQERHAASLGTGHRIIHGVAGSGKTVLLIARARLLASEDPTKEVLLLCFNVALAAYLEARLADCRNVVVRHFDGWARSNGVTRQYVGHPGIKVQTMHSSKGLQYQAVIILWADQLPAPFADADIEADRRLFYVGLTRAEDYLAITHSGDSPFIDLLKHGRSE